MSLTHIRRCYGVEVFRHFFDTVMEQCQQAGLVWGKELYSDATKVQANASLDSLRPRFAVEAHLAALFPSEIVEKPEPGREVEQRDSTSPDPLPICPPDGTVGEVLSPGEHPLQAQQAASPTPRQLHSSLESTTREELSRTNEERHDWIERLGEPDRAVMRGTYRRMSDFQMSTTDPDATVMSTKRGGSHLGYHTHYIVDGGKARIILATLVTPSDVMENQPVLDLLWLVGDSE